jgi:hypothetical protein
MVTCYSTDDSSDSGVRLERPEYEQLEDPFLNPKADDQLIEAPSGAHACTRCGDEYSEKRAVAESDRQGGQGFACLDRETCARRLSQLRLMQIAPQALALSTDRPPRD